MQESNSAENSDSEPMEGKGLTSGYRYQTPKEREREHCELGKPQK